MYAVKNEKTNSYVEFVSKRCVYCVKNKWEGIVYAERTRAVDLLIKCMKIKPLTPFTVVEVK